VDYLLSNENIIKPYVGVIGTSLGGVHATALGTYCPKVFNSQDEIKLQIYFHSTVKLIASSVVQGLVKSENEEAE